MSQVMSLNYDLSGPFGDFGKNFQYTFNIVYMLENIMEVGINNTNVVVIPGDLVDESKEELQKYHIDTRAWRDDMLKHLHIAKNYQKIIHTVFEALPESFKNEYLLKFSNIDEQINEMKPI